MSRGSAKRESSRRKRIAPIFEAELKVQEGNITEAGEKEFTEELRTCLDGLSSQIRRLQKTTSAEEAKQLYFSELEAAFYQVKAAADEILAINQDAMVRKSDAVRRTGGAHESHYDYRALCRIGAGCFVSISVDPPHVAAAVGAERGHSRIGEGNFDTRAHVRGNDELAQLAHDFNAMAARLAEYRKSSLGDLLQAHLSMQAAIDSLPDPVVIFSVGGDLQNVNHAAQTLLGLSAETGVKEPLKPWMRRCESFWSACAAMSLRQGRLRPRGFEDAVQLPTLLGDRYFLPRGARFMRPEAWLSVPL